MAYNDAHPTTPQDALSSYAARLHRMCGYMDQTNAVKLAEILLGSHDKQGPSHKPSHVRLQLAATLLRQALVLNPFDGKLLNLVRGMNAIAPVSPIFHRWLRLVEEFHETNPELAAEPTQNLSESPYEDPLQHFGALVNERNPAMLFRGILALWERGQWEAVEALSERLLKLPTGPLGAPHLAWAAWAAGEKERAKKWLSMPTLPTFMYFNLQAEMAYAEGMSDAARQFLQKSLEWDRHQPHVCHRYWEILQPSPPPLSEHKKRVHILFYTYNKLEMTLRTLQSLISSDIGDAAIFLLNNGSTSFAAEDLEHGVQAVAQSRPVHLIHLPVNIGAPGARNWLWHLPEMRAADYVAFLDDDVILPSDWLKLYLEDFNLFPRAVAVGPRGVNPDSLPTIQYVHRYFQEVGEQTIRFTPAAPTFMDLGQYSYRHPCLSVMGCCHVFDRRRWEALGIPDFDIRFSPSQVDDLEHDIQIWKAGGEVVYDGRVRVVHLQQAGRQAPLSEASWAHVWGNHLKMECKFLAEELVEIDGRVRDADHRFCQMVEKTVQQELRTEKTSTVGYGSRYAAQGI